MSHFFLLASRMRPWMMCAILMPLCIGYGQELRDSVAVPDRWKPRAEWGASRTNDIDAVPLRTQWTPAWEPIVPQESLSDRLFTTRMLRDATLGDPNRSVRIYRSDPNYYRMTSFSLLASNGITPGPTDSDFLNRLVNTLYVRLREEVASGRLTAYDYMTVPGNTGMITSFDDCKETAFMRGEEQAADVLSRIAVGVWPYRPRLFPLSPVGK